MRTKGSRTLLLASVLAIFGVLFRAAPTAAQSVVQPADSSFQVYMPIAIQPSPISLLEQKVVDLTNELRQQYNCPPFAVSLELSAAAHDHSQDMADNNYFSHIDLNGHTPGWRAQHAGYTGTAGWENIAAGYTTAADVVTNWFNSSSHRRNMLDCSLTDIGVGYGYSTGSTYHSYWTQNFGHH